MFVLVAMLLIPTETHPTPTASAIHRVLGHRFSIFLACSKAFF
jgi:hypothetical protein